MLEGERTEDMSAQTLVRRFDLDLAKPERPPPKKRKKKSAVDPVRLV